jgi:hypothetical protein
MRWMVVMTAALLAGCGVSERQPAEQEQAKADAAPRTIAPEALPLTRGFYVSDGTPCGEASNATLGLLRRTGWNGSQYACDFARIEPTGENRFRITETCTDIRSGDEWRSTRGWTLTGADSFRISQEDGTETSFRHCPQPSLPEGWRDNDIEDLIAQ